MSWCGYALPILELQLELRLAYLQVNGHGQVNTGCFPANRLQVSKRGDQSSLNTGVLTVTVTANH